MNENGACVKRVTDAPYLASGDGKTCDRAAIQQAIDDVYAAGGGTVLLTAGRTFLTAGLTLRSGVTLLFEDGAVLLQSPDAADYVKPGKGEREYVPYTPAYGHNFSPEIKWSHNWYHNYPLIFAPAGSSGFAVRGRGTIRMMEVADPEKIIKICPIGFFRCSDFEIADVHITNYHSYAVMPFSCERGVFRDLKIDNWSHGNGDGICLMNCRDIRVTGCSMYTGDDAVYIFSSYRDPRRSEWWDSDTPQASENIEIDHNDLRTNHCKAFGMILWGIECPDQELVEVRNVYVHDNRFETMGNWNYNPYTVRGGHPPVTGMRFENNTAEGIEINFFETYVSDMIGYRSMPELQNGGFGQGRAFWNLTESVPGQAGVCRGEEESFGWLADAEKGPARLYEGLWLEGGRPMLLRAETMGEGSLTVRDQATDEVIARTDFHTPDWAECLVPFTLPAAGNYRLGLENGKAGFARVKNVVLGAHPAAGDYTDVVYDRGKMIFRY